MSEAYVTYTLYNKDQDARTVILEPWAEEWVVRKGSVISFDIFSNKPGLLETALTSDYTIVYAWWGCRVKVTMDGVDETRTSLRIAAPFG